MKKGINVYSKIRGFRTLKYGVTLETYQKKYPDAIRAYPPDPDDLNDWISDCGCEAIDGCWVEPDGECSHGYPSWFLALGII